MKRKQTKEGFSLEEETPARHAQIYHIHECVSLTAFNFMKMDSKGGDANYALRVVGTSSVVNPRQCIGDFS